MLTILTTPRTWRNLLNKKECSGIKREKRGDIFVAEMAFHKFLETESILLCGVVFGAVLALIIAAIAICKLKVCVWELY